jgi:flagellin-specific chaperone FliS
MQLGTAGHGRIIWMMHAKCVFFIKQSQVPGIDLATRKTMLIRAQNLLAELESALKITDDVSRSLFVLYDYCYSLLDADTPKTQEIAINLLTTLRDALAGLLKKPPLRR